MNLKDYEYYRTDLGVLYHGDCLDIMPMLPRVDLVLTDPPYGIAYDRNIKHIGEVKNNIVLGDDKPFDPKPLLIFKSLIIWGGNYFASKLPDSKTWIVWEKTLIDTSKSGQTADFELAWSNCIGRSRIFRNLWAGCYRSSETREYYHPTQKPISLMVWCLSLGKWNLILDSYLGSGTTAVACERLGRRWIGIEIEEKYCAIAKKRIEKERQQLKLFSEKGEL